MNSISDTFRRSRIIRDALVGATFVTLLLGLLHLKVSLDVQRNYRPYVFDASYSLPSAKVIRAATLNFRTAAADMVWVSGVQFVADSIISQRTADDVTYYAETLTNLDPYFYKVYSWHSGARMLTAGYPSPEDIEAANDILEIGMEYFPQDPRLPQEATANYIGFNRGVDRATRIRQLERGIEFADAAATRSGGQQVSVFLGARFRERLARLKRKSGQTETAPHGLLDTEPDMLVRLYFQANSKLVRDSILSRLQRAQGSEQLVTKLQAYSEQQNAWYETSSMSYMPFALFSTVATPPPTDVSHDQEKSP